MFNKIKQIIYKALTTIQNNNVYYSVAPDNAAGLKVVYSIINISDDDDMGQDNFSVDFQVAVYDNSLQNMSSNNVDTLLATIHAGLKLEYLQITGGTVYTNTLLPVNTVTAIYDNDRKEWLGFIRFNAIFETTN